MIMNTSTSTATVMPTDAAVARALRLANWLSPSFPTGAYAYSHALEWAVEAGTVTDLMSAANWLETDLRYGTGRTDAILFSNAHRALVAGDADDEFLEIARLAAALKPTAEFALESAAQGTAFLGTVDTVWPQMRLAAVTELLSHHEIAPVLPIAAAACFAAHGITASVALPLFLQAAVSNLANAAVRLVPLGQSDGQRVIALLEPAIASVAAETLEASLDALGSATVMVDIASMRHETQYTRLFRS